MSSSSELTYCPHQFHCRACETRIQHLVQSWMAKVDALQREQAENEAAIVDAKAIIERVNSGHRNLWLTKHAPAIARTVGKT